MLILGRTATGTAKNGVFGRELELGPNKYCSTISAFQSLLDELEHEGWEYILTARLNQDVVENFFSQIRGLGGKR